MLDSTELCELSVATLNDNKALNIKVIDVKTLTDVTDTMILCTATSTRHAGALADKLLRVMRSNEVKPLGIEGQQAGDWILVDLQDVIIHIMLEETRELYELEKLWKMAENARSGNET